MTLPSNPPATTTPAALKTWAQNVVDTLNDIIAGDIALSVPDDAYDAIGWDGNLELPSKNAVRDKIESILDGQTFTGDIVVPDEAYDATNWDGSLEVPTKNALRDKIETLGAGLTFRGCRVYRSAALSLANGGTTPVAWDAETYDTNALHDTGSNPSRVVLNAVGKWLCVWQVAYAANGTGVRDAILTLNGSNVAVREISPAAATSAYVTGSDVVVASAITDYVEVVPFQNSGGSLAFDVGTADMFLSATYLGA